MWGMTVGWIIRLSCPSVPSYFALSSTSLVRYKQGNQQTKGQTPLQHCKCIYLNNAIWKCINNCRATMFNVIVAEVEIKENHWIHFCIIQLLFVGQISKLICLGLIWHEICTCLLLLIMLWCITLDRKPPYYFPYYSEKIHSTLFISNSNLTLWLQHGIFLNALAKSTNRCINTSLLHVLTKNGG